MTDSANSQSVIRATLIIGVFSLLAKLSGLARDAIFSHEFGTSQLIDAYFAAFRIPDFIFNLLILGTMSVAFIPIFSGVLRSDKEHAYKFASSILNITFLCMLAISFIGFVFIDPLTRLIAPGFEGEVFELTKTFTKILLFAPIFHALSSVVSSVLNTYKRFTLMAAAPLLYNLGIIVGVLVFYPWWGPSGLVLGVVFGAILHLAVQVPQIFALGFHFVPKIELDGDFYRFWRLYWPRIFSMGTGQVTLLVATFFGSFLGTGSLSAFYYANNLHAVFLSIFAVSAALAVFPTLSDLYNQKNDMGFKDLLAKTTIQILYFMIPLSVLMLILRAQIVRLVLGIGEGTNFTFADTRVVSLTLGLFVVSLFAQGLIPLFTRAFYARHNTLAPVAISLLIIAVNVAATYFLVRRFGIPGLAMAFSLTSILHLLILVAELHYKIGNIHDEYLILSSLKIAVSSVMSGLLTYISLYAVAPLVDMQTYLGVLIQAVGAGTVGIISFLLVSLLIGLDETKNIVGLLRSYGAKLRKPLHVIANIWE